MKSFHGLFDGGLQFQSVFARKQNRVREARKGDRGFQLLIILIMDTRTSEDILFEKEIRD
jgi:hypothetical protein